MNPWPIDGDLIVIAGLGDKGACPDGLYFDYCGLAYVFRWNGANWIEEATFRAADVSLFGSRVSVSGSRLLVGAPYEDDLGTNSGAVYAFRREGSNWIEETKLTASDGRPLDFFGRSVSLNGDVAVIGAPQGTGWSETTVPGKAYLFRREGTEWTEVAILAAPNSRSEDHFGGAVAINDGAVIVGARHHDSSGDNVGAAYLVAGDCNENGIPDECDIAAGMSEDCTGNGIPSECECNDGDVCTWDRCIDAACAPTTNSYGDVDHDGDIDVFDLFCILNGLAGDFGACSLADDEIEPCSGDGDIDLFDLFAVINAFSGEDPCCGG